MSLTTTIKILDRLTREIWLQQALENLDTILLDRSHCEKKAVSMAINLMFRYPASRQLVKQLTAIAKEELSVIESEILATLYHEPRIHS